MTAFRMGINYWPRRSAMYMWERFDIGEIREDFARIAELGLDVVRFFVSWDAFAPHPGDVDRTMLGRFDEVMTALADAGLGAMPTLFCGHMSGVNWLPKWTLDSGTPHGRFRTMSGGEEQPYGIGDFYADEMLLRAQVLMCERIGERARGHEALYCWELGNEFSNLREPNSPDDAAAWSARLSDALARRSGGAVTGGTHGEDVERDRHLRPSSLCAPWTIATMHGYAEYATFARDRTDTDVVPFYARLMEAMSNKPTLFSEFGAPLDDEACAQYASDVLPKLVETGTLGALWWCWADYVDEIAHLPPFDKAPHELHFGIVRKDGTYKPVADVLARFAAGTPRVQPQPQAITDESTFYASLPDGIQTLYRHYRS